MKKLFFFAALLVAASFTTVNAQCTKSKTAGAKTACCASKTAKATTVSADAKIEKRVCADSGVASYFRNEMCATSGKMVSTEVKLDPTTGTFVNVSPNRAAMPAAETAGAKKACCASKTAGAKKTCSAAEKAACAKSCTKGKSTKQASTQMSNETPARATLTKGESN